MGFFCPNAVSNKNGCCYRPEYKSGCWIPIIGIIPAAVKIVLGILQTALALICTILSSPFALFNDDASAFCKRSFSHVVHGGGNICAGIAEMFACSDCVSEIRDFSRKYQEQQYDKLIAYSRIVPEEENNQGRSVTHSRSVSVYPNSKRLKTPLLSI